jgi:hypothetical protein
MDRCWWGAPSVGLSEIEGGSVSRRSMREGFRSCLFCGGFACNRVLRFVRVFNGEDGGAEW